MKESLLLYNLKLNCLIFFYQSKQLTDYIYTDIYCKLSKCIGQTPCSYEHYLVKDYVLAEFVFTLLWHSLYIKLCSVFACQDDVDLLFCKVYVKLAIKNVQSLFA